VKAKFTNFAPNLFGMQKIGAMHQFEMFNVQSFKKKHHNGANAPYMATLLTKSSRKKNS
jgi:hypothetical protein